jgi:hypothetical protein
MKNKGTVLTQTQRRKRLIIIKRFRKYVRGRKPAFSSVNINHDGRGGYWLEKQMGIAHNARNSPDIMGYEMKNNTPSKTSFGDWSAHYYIFKDKEYGLNRNRFMSVFGKYNPRKRRYSWSGSPIPKINVYNDFGAILLVDKSDNIKIYYNFRKDARTNKRSLVPRKLQKSRLLLAQWDAKWMRIKVENKFNKAGWFKCIKDADGFYTKIVFGDPISYKLWLKGVRKGLIFFDSGMYQGNSRNYSQWRADNSYWDLLVTETY